MKFITSGLTSPDNGQLATKHYKLESMNKSFFQEILEKINEHQDSSIIEELSYHFSQTPDNEQCGEAVGIRRYKNPYTGKNVCGLKTKNYPLSEIANAVEDKEDEVFDVIKQALPRLTKKEWEAFTRLTTLIYCDLEKEIN